MREVRPVDAVTIRTVGPDLRRSRTLGHGHSERHSCNGQRQSGRGQPAPRMMTNCPGPASHSLTSPWVSQARNRGAPVEREHGHDAAVGRWVPVSRDMPGTGRVAAPSCLVEPWHRRKALVLGRLGEPGHKVISSGAYGGGRLGEGAVGADDVLADDAFVTGRPPLSSVIVGELGGQALIQGERCPGPARIGELGNSLIPCNGQPRPFRAVHTASLAQLASPPSRRKWGPLSRTSFGDEVADPNDGRPWRKFRTEAARVLSP
jgi:hypothetical protein